MSARPTWVATGVVVLALGCGLLAFPRLFAGELPGHRDLNRRSCFSGWVQHWTLAVPGDAVERRLSGSSEGATAEEFMEGWARHHVWDHQFFFKLVAGQEEQIVPALAASIRTFASAESCQAESLRFVEWQTGRDFIHARYETRFRWGELFVWSAHGPDAVRSTGDTRRFDYVPWGMDHSVSIRLTEEPNTLAESRRLGTAPH